MVVHNRVYRAIVSDSPIRRGRCIFAAIAELTTGIGSGSTMKTPVASVVMFLVAALPIKDETLAVDN